MNDPYAFEDESPASPMMAAPFEAPTVPGDFPKGRYEARFVSAHDGDTVTLEVCRSFAVRIMGIDTPEIRSNAHGKADVPAAVAARDHLVSIVKDVPVYVVERGTTLGRVLANLYVERPDGTLADVGLLMIEAGHAVPYP